MWLCYRREQIGTIWCYSCGTPMANIPISAKQLADMVQDSSQTLLQNLGLRVKVPDSATDSRRARGNKAVIYRDKTWAERCNGWRHGALKKKDATGQYLYAHSPTPITLRWENDEAYRRSCNEQSQLYFGCDTDHDMALEADRIGWDETEAARERGQNLTMPSDRRQELYPALPTIRSQQAGGSNTRPRANTEHERRAMAAIKGKGNISGKSSGSKGRGQNFNV